MVHQHMQVLPLSKVAMSLSRPAYACPLPSTLPYHSNGKTTVTARLRYQHGVARSDMLLTRDWKGWAFPQQLTRSEGRAVKIAPPDDDKELKNTPKLVTTISFKCPLAHGTAL